MNRNKYGLFIISCLAVGIAFIWLFLERFEQDVGYHRFIDSNEYFGIPNALNVLTNIPFLVVGWLGIQFFYPANQTEHYTFDKNKLPYLMLFIGVFLVGLGSSYYHLFPNNQTLVWDRIPMTIGFMSLFAIVMSEFVSEKIGKFSFIPLLMMGVGSVLYWWYTESVGQGDLRFYAAVQLLPIVTIPILLLFFTSQKVAVSGYWLVLFAYLLAKIAEIYDAQIFELLGFISGHSLKHLIAALGLYWLLRFYIKRQNG